MFVVVVISAGLTSMSGSDALSGVFAGSSNMPDDVFVDSYLIPGTSVLVNPIGAKTRYELLETGPLPAAFADARLRGRQLAAERSIAQL
jgi:hypothetical protein